MQKFYCDKCGKEIEPGFHHRLWGRYNYGSCQDGKELCVDMCPDCMDKVTAQIIEGCVNQKNLIVDVSYDY